MGIINRLTTKEKISLDKYIAHLKKPYNYTVIDFGEFEVIGERLYDKKDTLEIVTRANNLTFHKRNNKTKLIHNYIILGLGYSISKSGAISFPNFDPINYVEDAVCIKFLGGNSLFDNNTLSILNNTNSSISHYLVNRALYWRNPLSDRKFTLIGGHKRFKYIPKGKEDKDSNYQEIKIGRITSKLGISDFSCSSIEKFVNKIIALDPNNVRFKIIKGKEIKDAYNKNSNCVEEKLGSLENSCMKHSYCKTWFSIYTRNRAVCSMLVLLSPFDKDKIIGRALLWKSVSGDLIMDRIYGSDSTIIKFKNWAKINGYYSKYQQSYGNLTEWDYGNNVKIYKQFKIKANVDYRKYPYLDTFSYIYSDKISNAIIPKREALQTNRSYKGIGLPKINWVKEFKTNKKLADVECKYVTSVGGWVNKNKLLQDHYHKSLYDFKDKFLRDYYSMNIHISTKNICEKTGRILSSEHIKVVEGKKYSKHLVIKCIVSNEYILKIHSHKCVYLWDYFDKRNNDYIKLDSGNYLLRKYIKHYECDKDIKIKKSEIIYKNY